MEALVYILREAWMLLLKLSMAAYWLSNLMDQLVHESCLVDIDGLNEITFQ